MFSKTGPVSTSTGGIGLAVARQLKEEGALVVTSGRRTEGVGDLHFAADLAQAGAADELIGARGGRVRPGRLPRQQRRRNQHPPVRRPDRRRLAGILRAST